MTKYAIFDTEGTGLFQFKDANGVPVPADAPGQPRLAHLAMFMIDEQLESVDSIDLYAKPDGWSMPQGPGTAGEVNGLTDAFLREYGVPVREILDRYVEVIDAGYTLVAFNAQFDLKQMRAELRRAGMDDRFDRTPNICVMRAAMKLGVQKASGGGGYPKLADCARHLGIEFEAHTAGGDARAALALFRHLHSIGGLPEAKVHYAKVPPAHAVTGKRGDRVVLDEHATPSITPSHDAVRSTVSIPEKF